MKSIVSGVEFLTILASISFNSLSSQNYPEQSPYFYLFLEAFRFIHMGLKVNHTEQCSVS